MYAFAWAEHATAPVISVEHESLQSGGAVPHCPLRSQIAAHASSTVWPPEGWASPPDDGAVEGTNGEDGCWVADEPGAGAAPELAVGSRLESSPLVVRWSPAIFPPHAAANVSARVRTRREVMRTYDEWPSLRASVDE